MNRLAAQTTLLALALAASPIAAYAQKDLASCKPVLDAIEKQRQTPSHSYNTTEGVGGKSSTAEIIFVGGITYVNFRGQWRRSPLTAEAMKAQQQENIKNATSYVCKRVRDGVVDGTPATLYEARSENADTKSNSQMWIAKGTNLPLRNEITMDVGDGDKTHSSIRYDYSNVRAPAGVR